MRHLCVAVAATALLGLSLGSAQAGKVEISGAHLCCNQCKNIAKAILGKVEGVTDVRVTTTIAFTTADEKGTTAAVKALADNGYYGTVKDDGKDVKVELATPKSEKADSVTVKGVHVCCPQCQTALKKVFGDATVEFGKPGDNKVCEIKVAGKDLDKAKLVEALRAAGFNGTVE